jgi:hypothetical protein
VAAFKGSGHKDLIKALRALIRLEFLIEALKDLIKIPKEQVPCRQHKGEQR